jgi:hypothetical protein
MIFEKSNRKNKKYMVFYNGKWIHFGDTRYEQYRDSTPLKLYVNLDHLDPVRKKSYLARAKGIKDKDGNLTYLDKNSPNYYSIKYLWT